MWIRLRRPQRDRHRVYNNLRVRVLYIYVIVYNVQHYIYIIYNIDICEKRQKLLSVDTPYASDLDIILSIYV